MGIERTLDTALAAAVREAGSQSAFARMIGRSQPLVHDWLKRGTSLPPEHVLVVERETGISRHDLRPDVYGPAPGADATRDAQLVAIK